MRNKFSAILEYRLPDFVREDHDVFVAFVKAYYEFLEETGNVAAFIQKFEDNMDVDLAEQDFLDEFVVEMAKSFPRGVLIDSNMLVKIIKEFYLTRGSEQSFQFLFTLLYNTKVDVQYPRIFLQKSSSAVYSSDDYLTTTGDNEFKIRTELLKSDEEIATQVVGQTSGSTAVIDSITVTYFGSQQILRMDVSSYDGDFTPGEEVLITVNGITVSETVYGVVNGIQVDSGGNNYEKDDDVTITDSGTGLGAKANIKRLGKGGLDTVTVTAGGSGYEVGQYIGAVPTLGSQGYGFLAEIYSVDGGGAITAVRVINQGYDYPKKTTGVVKNSSGVGATMDITGEDVGRIVELEVYDGGIDYDAVGDITVSVSSTDGTGASFTPLLAGIFNEPKRYQNQDDWPSNYSVIQDSYYYQQFSYVIRSSISPHLWLPTVKRVLHPAGMRVFGSYLIEREFDVSVSLPSDFEASLKIVIELIAGASVISPTYAADYITLTREVETTCSTGLILSDLDHMKNLDTLQWPASTWDDVSLDDIYSPDCQPIMETQDGVDITITP